MSQAMIADTARPGGRRIQISTMKGISFFRYARSPRMISRDLSAKRRSPERR